MGKITVETPFSLSYPTAGVDVSSTLALPGRFDVKGDYKTGKIQVSWEFLGDKLRLARYSVIPFTTIRAYDDFTPSLLIKETQPIILLDKPKEYTSSFGGQHLGLKFVYTQKGDAQALQSPMSYSNDWFGSLAFSYMPTNLRYREYNLFLDNSNSETDIIKTLISVTSKPSDEVRSRQFSAKEDLFTTGLFRSIYGDKIKSDRFVSEQDDEWAEHKFKRVFDSMASPYGYSLDVSVEFAGKQGSSIKPRRYGTSVTSGFGDYGLSHRTHLIMEQRHELETEGENNFVFCMEYENKWPRALAVKREELMQEGGSVTTFTKIGFGSSCTNDRQITIKGELIRSKEDMEITSKTKWEEAHCAKQEYFGRGVSEECLSTRRLASTLNKGVVTINYNEMPPIVRNITVKVANAFRHYLGAYMYDNQVDVRNKENEIRIETLYYPVIGSMDLRVFKPKSNTFYHNIDIHPVAEVVLPVNPRLTAFRAAFGGPGLCLVDRNSVTTYDGLTYNATLSGCDHVITKDCSGRYKMAVLAREESGRKIVTVLLDKEKIEVNPAQMKIRVNGVEQNIGEKIYEIKDTSNTIIAQIRRSPDQFIVVDAPNHWIKVTLNAKEVIVLGSPIHRGRMCGLCGTQTGDKTDDLTGPKKCQLVDEVMDAAYELNQPAGCKSYSSGKNYQLLRQIQQECVQEESQNVFGISGVRSLLPYQQQSYFSSLTERSAQGCTEPRNKMIYREGVRCFSTEPVQKCREGCRPSSTTTKKLGFHCVPKGRLTDLLNEEMAERPLHELVGKQIDTVQEFKVPTSCVPY